MLIVFGLYLIVLKILFEKGFEKKENKTKQKRKLEIGKKKRERKPPRLQPEHPPSPSPRPSAAQEARALIFPSLLSGRQPGPALSFADLRGPRVSASPSPSSSLSRTRFHAELDPRKSAICCQLRKPRPYKAWCSPPRPPLCF